MVHCKLVTHHPEKTRAEISADISCSSFAVFMLVLQGFVINSPYSLFHGSWTNWNFDHGVIKVCTKSLGEVILQVILKSQ